MSKDLLLVPPRRPGREAGGRAGACGSLQAVCSVSAVTAGAMQDTNTLCGNPGKPWSCLLSGSAATTTSARYEFGIRREDRNTNVSDEQLPRALVLLTQTHGRVSWRMAASPGWQVLPRHRGTRAKGKKTKLAINFGCFPEKGLEVV